MTQGLFLPPFTDEDTEAQDPAQGHTTTKGESEIRTQAAQLLDPHPEALHPGRTRCKLLRALENTALSALPTAAPQHLAQCPELDGRSDGTAHSSLHNLTTGSHSERPDGRRGGRCPVFPDTTASHLRSWIRHTASTNSIQE